MFEFLTPKAILWAFLVNAWTGVSLPALTGLGVGVAMVVFAAVAPFWMPVRLRVLLVVAGIPLATAGFCFQAGKAEGVRVDQVLQHQRALQAETDRADAAEAIKNRIAAQAASDLAALRASYSRLKVITDALRTDPRRDSECLDRGLARRLRAL